MINVDPTKAEALRLDKLRIERDKALAESDWTQMADSPLTNSEKQAWADYRQSLRDLPSKPKGSKWPDKPKKA